MEEFGFFLVGAKHDRRSAIGYKERFNTVMLRP